MKKLNLIIFIVAAMMVACNGKKEGPSPAELQRDSISNQYDELQSFHDVVSGGMDSITTSEGYITRSPEGTPLSSREKVKQNLANFKDLVAKEKAKITKLEQQLRSSKNANSSETRKMLAIIKNYREQLDEKDKEIADLNEKLKNKDVDISNLQTQVTSLNDNVTSLTSKNDEQAKQIEEQTNKMNECFVKVGTKAELKKEGLLAGKGLFAKKTLNASNIDNSTFDQKDMRTFSSITVKGKKPVILTHMPASSYKITVNSDGTSTLTVLNSKSFWSICNYLIIESK